MEDQNNRTEKYKYFVYCRKSSEDNDRQIQSLESQEGVLLDIAKRYDLKIIEILKESKSAKSPDKRPIFDKMIREIKSGKAQGILCWKLDRLARNPDEAGKIIGMLQRGEIKHIKTNEKDYYPEDNSVISYVEFGIADQYSRDLGKNVKRGMKTKLEKGWYPCKAPLGYENSINKGKGNNDIAKDPKRFETVKRMWQMLLTGNYTAPLILDIATNKWKFRTHQTNRPLPLSCIYDMFNNPFYCGRFEYPKGSGDWYAGKHEAMITEKEFERVQFLLGRTNSPKLQKHQFEFTGIMRCGHCDCGITAEIKNKRQKCGKTHQYIYYHCTRKKDKHCPEKAIRMEKLTEQVNDTVDKLVVPQSFLDWSIKYLHEVRNNEIQSQEAITQNKQEEIMAIDKQLNVLFLKFIDQENLHGELISNEEYKTRRAILEKQKRLLQESINSYTEQVDEYIQLAQRTFNFATYAYIWFKEGDRDTKRSIFNCLGSNPILKDQIINFSLHRPFQFIANDKKAIEDEFGQARTSKNLSNKAETANFLAEFPVGRPQPESDRCSLVENQVS